MGEMRNVCFILVGTPQGKTTHGEPGRRWENNIRMTLKKVGHDGMD